MKEVPPIRLRDDPAAPPLLRADLARAKNALPAVAFDAARGLAALEAAIQAGGAPVAPTGAAADVDQRLRLENPKGLTDGRP